MRLLVLEQYGGVYFDTDVEVVRDISPLLNDEGFIGLRMTSLSTADRSWRLCRTRVLCRR